MTLPNSLQRALDATARNSAPASLSVPSGVGGAAAGGAAPLVLQLEAVCELLEHGNLATATAELASVLRELERRLSNGGDPKLPSTVQVAFDVLEHKLARLLPLERGTLSFVLSTKRLAEELRGLPRPECVVVVERLASLIASVNGAKQ